MALLLALVGIGLILAGFRGTYGNLGSLLANDLTGKGNFGYWVAALVVIAAVGYIPGLRGPSRAFLALLVLVFVLSNNGVFNKLVTALGTSPQAVTPQGEAATPPPSGSLPVQLSVTGGSSGGSSTAANVIGGVAKALPIIGGLFG